MYFIAVSQIQINPEKTPGKTPSFCDVLYLQVVTGYASDKNNISKHGCSHYLVTMQKWAYIT